MNSPAISENSSTHDSNYGLKTGAEDYIILYCIISYYITLYYIILCHTARKAYIYLHNLP